jgi:hypothetical protein
MSSKMLQWAVAWQTIFPSSATVANTFVPERAPVLASILACRQGTATAVAHMAQDG